jgi:SAM-dependent methyltransferase
VKWGELDIGRRHTLLAWHAKIWEPLLAWGLQPLGDLQGKRVLEIGCGDGGLACLLALCGAEVYATDLSRSRLERARRLADSLHLLNRVHLFNASAYQLPLPEKRVSLVITRSVLVLLDRSVVLPHLTRSMTDDGAGLFIENMQHHPALSAWRRLTRTKWGKYPYFSMAEIDTAFGAHFDRVDTHFSGLLLPFAGASPQLEDAVAPALQRIDQAVLKAVPRLNAYAWLVALRCSQPTR